MHVSNVITLEVLATILLADPSRAASIPNIETRSAPPVRPDQIWNHLDAHGHIEWQTFRTGRTAIVSSDLVTLAHYNLTGSGNLNQRGWEYPKISRHFKFFDTQKVAGQSAAVACMNHKGANVLISDLRAPAVDACDVFLAASSAGTLLNGAYSLYNTANSMRDISNDIPAAAFYFLRIDQSAKGATTPPQLTSEICNGMFAAITDYVCAQSDDSTYGAMIEVGQDAEHIDQGSYEGGINPNSAKDM